MRQVDVNNSAQVLRLAQGPDGVQTEVGEYLKERKETVKTKFRLLSDDSHAELIRSAEKFSRTKKSMLFMHLQSLQLTPSAEIGRAQSHHLPVIIIQ